jgi:hypothetical protein
VETFAAIGSMIVAHVELHQRLARYPRTHLSKRGAKAVAIVRSAISRRADPAASTSSLAAGWIDVMVASRGRAMRLHLEPALERSAARCAVETSD